MNSHLSPVQYLITDTLAARSRLGERLWTFPTAIGRKHFDALEDAGLVGWKAGVVEHTLMAWLTPAGEAEFLSANYVPPIAEKFGEAVAQCIQAAGDLASERFSPISTEDSRSRYVLGQAIALAAKAARDFDGRVADEGGQR